jgi:hypothetical protein
MGVSSVKELERQAANLKRRLRDAEARIECVRTAATEEVSRLTANVAEAEQHALAAEAKLDDLPGHVSPADGRGGTLLPSAAPLLHVGSEPDEEHGRGVLASGRARPHLPSPVSCGHCHGPGGCGGMR